MLCGFESYSACKGFKMRVNCSTINCPFFKKKNIVKGHKTTRRWYCCSKNNQSTPYVAIPRWCPMQYYKLVPLITAFKEPYNVNYYRLVYSSNPRAF